MMELKLKTISKGGIPEAISKVDVYRSLNEPEEAESICRDILAVDPEHQLALRLLASPSQTSSVGMRTIVIAKQRLFSRH